MWKVFLPPVLALAGCFAEIPTVASVTLAHNAAENPIAAQRDFGGQFVRVQGTVLRMTTESRETLVATRGFGTVQSRNEHETLALVVLEPGSVMCYFEPENLGDAAQVKKGSTVTFGCRFDSVQNTDAGTTSVLGACRLLQQVAPPAVPPGAEPPPSNSGGHPRREIERGEEAVGPRPPGTGDVVGGAVIG